jgi:hypothetical protein
MMLMKPISAPLICIKTFCYFAPGMVMPTPSSASAQSIANLSVTPFKG